MSKTTVQQVERIKEAIEAAEWWYSATTPNQTVDYVMERLRMHATLPTLIAAAKYQLDEILGIVGEDNGK